MKSIKKRDSDAVYILYVDDDEDYAEMVVDFLERQDDKFEIETANSANDGLTLIADSNFDCIISDHGMSRQNGIEFLQSIRENYPDLPFILYTAKGSEKVASDAISAGANEYVRKGTGSDHFEVFANRIKTVVEQTRSEQQYQQLVGAIETAHEGIGILDVDGYHIIANQSYADAYCIDVDELIGKHYTEIYPEKEIEYIQNEINPTVEESGYWSGQITGLRADGTTFVQDCTVSATEQRATVVTVQDTTEIGELSQERSRYQALIKVLKDPVYVLDEEGQFDFVNDAFIEKFGYERHELLGNGISVLKDETAVEQGRDNLGGVLSSDGSDSVYFETEIQGKNGDSILCEDHMTALPYEGDKFDGSVGILRDISTQKEREQELERRNKRLDRFASIVSHDLRNPLNIVEGNVELLREECDSERIDTIERSLTRMSDLIDDLLSLSRVGDEISDREPVSLAELSKDCWQNVETTDATVDTKTDNTIRADRSRLAQLFENLMRNAIEHTNHDVTITVGDLEDGLYIEDDGSGIPEEDRDDVLEAGYTTAEEGTGFGLSIVNQVVEAHGWDICITEGSESGARFEITNVDFDST